MDRAIKVAKRSTNKRHRTGAVITTSSGEFISCGWAHQSQLIYRQTPHSMHAEMHAIIRARPGSLVNAVIWIVTLTRANNVTLAKPCWACDSLLDHVGIEAVHYSVRGMV